MNVSGNFGQPLYTSSSGVVKSSQGMLFGFLCSVSGTLDLYDGVSTSGTHFVQGLAVTAGQFVPIPSGFASGLYAALSGGAAGTFVFV